MKYHFKTIKLGSFSTATLKKTTQNPCYFHKKAIIPPMKKKPDFTVTSPYQPAGDQPGDIKVLTKSILDGA